MSRNAEVNQRMRDARREKILSHALRLFAARGVAATKISDIAESAGMSQGLLYHYFRSKEEIFNEIVRNAFAKMNSAAHGLEALPATPREKIQIAMTQLVRSIAESAEFAATVMLIAQAGMSDATPAEAQAIIRAESGIPYDVIARIMRAGQQDGTIKLHDAEQLTLVFWTTIKGLALHRAVQGEAFRSPDPAILTSMFLTDVSQGETNAH